MREGWRTAKLADLCEFRNGLWKGKKPPYVHVGVIRNTNFRADGSLDDSDIAYLDVEQKQFEKRSLQYGDLILEKSGGGPKQPVGRVVLFDKEDALYSFSNFTSVIRVLDSSHLDFNYLHRVLYWYYLSGATEMMQRRSTGIRNLDFGAYKALDIPLPPLPEQKRIVAILDEAFAGIATAVANTEKNLANARELFESYLSAVFSQQGEGWKERSLADVCVNLDSKRVPITKSKRMSGEIPYYGASGVVDHVADYIFDEDLLLVSEDGANLLARTYPIAFSISGKSWVNNHAHVLRFDAIESQRFIEYYLNSISLEPYVSGMAQPKLNQKALNSIKVPFPPFDKQRVVVEKLDEIASGKRQLSDIHRQKLNALSGLRQSLLQKAFSGELTAGKAASDAMSQVEEIA